MKLGKYIVVEGNDGTGKSTQVELLAEWFSKQGFDVQVVEEPGSDDASKTTPVANELRTAIKNAKLIRSPEINLLLFSAARRELWREKIQPALARGTVVLSARNYVSTLAYQGRGEGVDEKEIVRVTALFTDERYMNPDATVVLVADDTLRQERIAKRGELDTPDTFESRGDDFQGVVNHAYAELAAEYGFSVVEAGRSIEEIQQDIRMILKDLL